MSALFTSFVFIFFIVAVIGKSVPCVTCDCCNLSLISITTSGAGAHSFESDELNTEGVNKSGIISDPATLVVTCNHGGTAWEMAGIAVTQVECSSSK